MALTMDMDSKMAELLLRAVLLDDASHVGEQLAALSADIPRHRRPLVRGA